MRVKQASARHCPLRLSSLQLSLRPRQSAGQAGLRLAAAALGGFSHESLGKGGGRTLILVLRRVLRRYKVHIALVIPARPSTPSQLAISLLESALMQRATMCMSKEQSRRATLAGLLSIMLTVPYQGAPCSLAWSTSPTQ